MADSTMEERARAGSGMGYRSRADSMANLTPEENEKIQKHLKEITQGSKGTWAEYSRQITDAHAQRIVERLPDPTIELKLREAFKSAASDLEAGMKASEFQAFVEAAADILDIPKPQAGEMVYNLLLRRFRRKGEASTRVVVQEALLMVNTIARVILHSYRVDVMVSSLSPYVQEILQSAAFAEELKNLKEKGASMYEEKLSKLPEDFDEIFNRADVGRSELLSWRTKQFSFFVGQALEHFGFPEPTGGDIVKEKMFKAFASEDSEYITKAETMNMVESALGAVIHELSNK